MTPNDFAAIIVNALESAKPAIDFSRARHEGSYYREDDIKRALEIVEEEIKVRIATGDVVINEQQ